MFLWDSNNSWIYPLVLCCALPLCFRGFQNLIEEFFSYICIHICVCYILNINIYILLYSIMLYLHHLPYSSFLSLLIIMPLFVFSYLPSTCAIVSLGSLIILTVVSFSKDLQGWLKLSPLYFWLCSLNLLASMHLTHWVYSIPFVMKVNFCLLSP